MLLLENLGPRIVVLGPSNSGKSTLATAVAKQLDCPIIFLDQLRHVPNTDWEVRPYSEFKMLHAKAISQDAWVMDGNYSALFEDRFKRATGIIFLRSNRFLRFYRYLKRTLTAGTDRIGGLAGGKDSIKWEMIDWVLFKSKKNSDRYLKMARATALPIVEVQSAKQLNAVYKAWGLLTKIGR